MVVSVSSDCEGVVAQATCRIVRLSGSLANMVSAAEGLLRHQLVPCPAAVPCAGFEAADDAEHAMVCWCCAAEVAVSVAAMVSWHALVRESAVATEVAFSFGVTILCVE